jgi:hypothetical protein
MPDEKITAGETRQRNLNRHAEGLITATSSITLVSFFFFFRNFETKEISAMKHMDCRY